MKRWNGTYQKIIVINVVPIYHIFTKVYNLFFIADHEMTESEMIWMVSLKRNGCFHWLYLYYQHDVIVHPQNRNIKYERIYTIFIEKHILFNEKLEILRYIYVKTVPEKKIVVSFLLLFFYKALHLHLTTSCVVFTSCSYFQLTNQRPAY